MKTKFLTEGEIESRASKLLGAYFSSLGAIPSLPVPIEGIVDFLDIPLRWESLPSRANELSVSKIVQPSLGRDCMIVINEDLQEDVFARHQWLERTALAHEVGHHQLHVQHSLQYQLTLELECDHSELAPTSMRSLVDGSEDDLIIPRRQLVGPSEEERRMEFQAHAFMRFLLMPEELLTPLLDGFGFLKWTGDRGIYGIADKLQVTPSALVVHLSRLGYIRVDNRKIYPGSRIGTRMPIGM